MKKFIVPFLIVLLAGVCFGDPNAVYRTSPPTLTSGDTSPLCVDSTGNLKTVAVATSGSANSLSRYKVYGTTYEANVKASSGNIYSLYCHNVNSTDALYLQLYNTATIPAAGDTPDYSFLVAASGTLFVNDDFFGPSGMNFANGIAWAISDTETTWEASLATNEVVFINYK